ncbi:hypothetical protein [Streptomyces sp. YS-3]|uniref:hypothetical protein n=1 Tax=Streptomyces sp. YS-3 TaxID=3381352 RepID=UPI0038622E50
MAKNGKEHSQSVPEWLEANRLGVAILLGLICMGVVFLVVHEAVVAVICGVVFAAVLAAALPRRPVS